VSLNKRSARNLPKKSPALQEKYRAFLVFAASL